jgi:hypothetical protein
MAIKAVIDKLEDVDEKYRDLYTEKNGKFELTGVEGMKTQGDVDRLTVALEKERKDHKGTKQKFEIFGDRKAEDILADLDTIPALKAAAEGKFDEGKVNELVEKRIGAKTGPLERKITQLTKDSAEKDTLIEGFKSKEATRSIHDAVREAVGKATGFQATALEDALMFAERHLHINEEGKVVTKDNVGVTPGVDAVVWLTEQKEKRPHWWGDTKGGGARGNNGSGGSGGSDNPWARETWNMTKQGQLVRENRTRAEQLAKSAGTSIGGPMPKPKQ